MSFATEMQAVATELLTEFGQPAVWRRPPHNFDRFTAAIYGKASALLPVNAVLEKKGAKFDEATTMLAQTARIMVSGEEQTTEPMPGDEFYFAATADINYAWRVLEVEATQPGDTAIVYELEAVFGGSIKAGEVPALATSGSTTTPVVQTAHGLAVKDWIGFDGTNWVKVKATSSYPRCEGVVSEVIDADTFVLTGPGPIRIAAHGYSNGPLYLSQATAGVATSTLPTTGYVQQIGVVFNANEFIVQTLPQVVQ